MRTLSPHPCCGNASTPLSAGVGSRMGRVPQLLNMLIHIARRVLKGGFDSQRISRYVLTSGPLLYCTIIRRSLRRVGIFLTIALGADCCEFMLSNGTTTKPSPPLALCARYLERVPDAVGRAGRDGINQASVGGAAKHSGHMELSARQYGDVY